jgi:membrane protein DedA with SNARE-associated domain/membrane-associated phospholipid phosphatase
MSFIERILDIPPDVVNPWAYWFILLISLCEPIPLLGAVVPGQILLLLAGVMVKRGVLDFGDAVAFATIGAILGDLANYGLGKRYGEAILTKYGKHVFLNPDRLERVKELLLRYAGRTLILGRFSSVTRWAAPFLSGSMGMSFLKFMIYNVVGGLGWSLALVALGWFFGEGIEIASRHLGRYLLIAFLLGVLIVLMVKWKNKGKPVFHPDHRYVLIMNILSLALLSKIIEDALTGKGVAGWDLEIRGRVVEYWNPAMDAILKAAYAASGPWYCGLAGLAAAIAFLARRKWYLAWFLATGMGGGMALAHGLGMLIRRAGPEQGQLALARSALPDLHATAATLFFCLAIFLFKAHLRSLAVRSLYVAANILLMILAAGSGIWLNIHWASDVIGGMMLGLFWLTLLILIYKNFIPGFRDAEPPPPSAPGPWLAAHRLPF